MNIRRVHTKRGIRSVLTYWYRGWRYRPVLGYGLTLDQERDEARKIINAIHDNVASSPNATATGSDSPTFREFAQTYLNHLKTKRCADFERNEAALTRHLIPHFREKRLREIRKEDGRAYIDKRRAERWWPKGEMPEKEPGRPYSDGTIERECAVLSALLNLAVEDEKLDRNRLKKLPIPEYRKRERVLEGWELRKLQGAASPDVWRAIMVALQTGLREAKIIEAHQEWRVECGDGPWLVPAPGRTRNKRVPKAVPLNQLADEALRGMIGRIRGRFFSQWKDGNSFKHRWQDTCERAGVFDFRFHDLRHTFATWLMQAGADYVVIEKLLGHKLPGTGNLYVHDWDGRLREAVTKLERFTKAKLREELPARASQVPLGVPPSYLEQSPTGRSARKLVPRDRIELSTPAFSGLCSAN